MSCFWFEVRTSPHLVRPEKKNPLSCAIAYPLKGFLSKCGEKTIHRNPRKKLTSLMEVCGAQTFLMAFNAQFYCYLDASGLEGGGCFNQRWNFAHASVSKNSSLAGWWHGWIFQNLTHAAWVVWVTCSHSKTFFEFRFQMHPNRIRRGRRESS